MHKTTDILLLFLYPNLYLVLRSSIQCHDTGLYMYNRFHPLPIMVHLGLKLNKILVVALNE